LGARGLPRARGGAAKANPNPGANVPSPAASLTRSPPLPLQGLYNEMCFTKPSRIQAETLPMILTNPPRALIAQAHNGSGKTTCFVLGMLSRCDPKLRAPQALCMCPTRELVVQNVEVLRKLATHTGITCCTSATEGGRGARATASLADKISDQVVISTPGTLKTWLQRKQLPIKCASPRACCAIRLRCSAALGSARVRAGRCTRQPNRY
jgi:superfamily II DNA/RNA helicase